MYSVIKKQMAFIVTSVEFDEYAKLAKKIGFLVSKSDTGRAAI